MPEPIRRSLVIARETGLAMAVVVAACGLAAAQTAAQSPAKTNAVRASGGHPDLQGVWGFATITPLQRPRDLAGKGELTAEDRAKLEDQALRNEFIEAPPRAGDVGAYNKFWIDAGTKAVKTGRNSLIVDPPDGRLPPLTPAGQQRQAALEERTRIAAGPEDLTTWDRCLVGFNAGPPMIGGGYNAYVQILQAGNYVALLNEMVHDTRVIPLDGRPHGKLRQWRGDSRGRWEGETLVVDTTNFRREGTGTLSLRGLGFSVDENLHLTERFRRIDATTLLYEYTVDDPTVWTRPWTVSMTMEMIQQPIYEYACHEGNYAMSHILSGARAKEAQK
ncbi:MAG TPA: hypothetical protein VH417_09905 [Vicinamibacterales bacterium]|jgi:hypothetical protein